ncbi:hypothetical protein CL659_04440 [bacterium]|nr:hypothetical protein [bacterium]|tara:strand:+ start:671 stop:1231 length:561 start_codon:yes stop_codon:yes gene_type:complete
MEDSSKIAHLHEKLKQDTGINLMPLKHWWAGDGSMPSRNICKNGLSRIINGILTNDESILSSIDIWLMQDAFCATDIAPEDIDIEKVLEWLRFESIKRNMAPRDNPVFDFYNSFISPLENWGRIQPSDIGFEKEEKKEEKKKGFFQKLLRGDEEEEEERMPLREIQDLPGFFTFNQSLKEGSEGEE